MTGEQPATTAQDGPAGLRRRHVFFIAGFDPKSPRWYQALYRRQASRRPDCAEWPIEVGRQRSQPTPFSTAWTITMRTSTGPVHTDYEMLQWDDIVRDHWSNSAWRVLLDGVRTVTFGLRDGAVQRMFRLFRPPVYATFLPLLVLALLALLAVAAGTAAATLVERLGLASDPGPLVLGAITTLALLWLALGLVHRIQITWLLRLVRFTHLHSTGRVAGLDRRLHQFAGRIAALSDASRPVDEILIVGHSVGATLAVSVIARLLEQLPGGAAVPARPGIALLSLGHCMPLLSSLSPARAFRSDLQRVAASTVDWLDITAPIDWAAFPATDPVSGAGLPAAPSAWRPLLLSPRFHQLFGSAGYARLKRNRFQVHMQYLMATERVGRYDYFAITAGPQSLRERFDDAPAEMRPVAANQ